MKTKLFLSALFGASIVLPLSAQNILNDPAIVAQHKRMVYESWGDWYPKPNYVLGVQTNVAYMTVWGMLAPARNRRYKEGEDIRPLKADGLETKRLLELQQQQKDAETTALQVDSLYTRNMQNFAYWTSATVDVDPLWLLYFKRMLQPLNDFPQQPQNYLQWGLQSNEQYETLVAQGEIRNLQEQLDLMKSEYNQSRTMAMPRGKRFLLYHKTLIDWRKFQDRLRNYNQITGLMQQYKMLLSRKPTPDEMTFHRTDADIVQAILVKYNSKRF